MIFLFPYLIWRLHCPLTFMLVFPQVGCTQKSNATDPVIRADGAAPLWKHRSRILLRNTHIPRPETGACWSRNVAGKHRFCHQVSDVCVCVCVWYWIAELKLVMMRIWEKDVGKKTNLNRGQKFNDFTNHQGSNSWPFCCKASALTPFSPYDLTCGFGKINTMLFVVVS